MDETCSRRFTLLDALILIAATAVGFACARLATNWAHSYYAFLNPNVGWLRFQIGAGYSVILLTAWSFTLLALATRARPSSLPQSLQVPGTAACAMSMVALISALLAKALWASTHRSVALHPANWADVGSWGPHAGMAVAAAWLVLAACGRWQRTADWIERAGRGVGIGWITLGIVDSVFHNAFDL